MSDDDDEGGGSNAHDEEEEEEIFCFFFRGLIHALDIRGNPTSSAVGRRNCVPAVHQRFQDPLRIN